MKGDQNIWRMADAQVDRCSRAISAATFYVPTLGHEPIDDVYPASVDGEALWDPYLSVPAGGDAQPQSARRPWPKNCPGAAGMTQVLPGAVLGQQRPPRLYRES